MKKEILFEERQRFKQWWLWFVLIGVNGIFIYGVVKQVFLGQQFGNNPMSDGWLMLSTQLSFLLTLFFFHIHLDTQIAKDGIYVRFFPFHLVSFKHYSWDKIEKVYVRKYNPIGEYGGWGIRIGLFGKGRAYNISGNDGIQIEFKNGKRLLIGTQKAEEARKAIENGEWRIEN